MLRRSPTLKMPAYGLGAMSLGVVPVVVAILVAGTSSSSAANADGSAWLSGWESTSDRVLSTFQATRAAEVAYYSRQFRIRGDLAGMIFDAARSQGIDPELAFRLIRVESSFRQRVVGPAGSVGYAQVQPQTAQWLDPSVTREKLFETETNLTLGFRYLRMLLDRYDNDTRLALLAYNRGPGKVGALLALGKDPANGYARRVLGEVAAAY
jgi:soluble lytic murein transglycosylase-like protein